MSNVVARLAINQSELFVNWPAEAIARLVDAADVVTMEAHACVKRSGESADYLYLLATGSMQLSRVSSTGREFTAWLYFAGDFHGIGPALTDTPFLYTATCKEPTTLVRIPATVLRELVYSDGRLAAAFFAVLDRRYRETLARHESATMHSTRERIGTLLCSFLARNIRCYAAGEVNLSQDEIATMLGTRRQVVNRALRELEAEGIVRVQYGRVTVLDMAKLSGLAQEGE